MNLNFAYTIEKDAENFINGTKSINNPVPTKLHELYFAEFGNELDQVKVESFIKKYLEENNINPQERVSGIKTSWTSVEDRFFEKIEKLFGLKYHSSSIDVYLTTNSRCTYNIPEGAQRIIMHEIFHFYTWLAFHAELIQGGMSDLDYNNIKESLTVLLNVEFKEFMEGEIDYGYPQHKEMRERIQTLWLENKDLKSVISTLIG